MKPRINIKRAFVLQWHVTNRCDQRCKHCYIYRGENQKPSSELSLNQCKCLVDDFLIFCEKMKCYPMMTITGGDPLLRPDIWDILRYVSEKKISFQILGNPFHLSEEVVKRLEVLGCKNYQLSLDGMDRTHDFIRKPGSFSATLEAIKLFEGSKVRVDVMNTVSRANFKELIDVIRLVVDLKVAGFAFARYSPTNGDAKFNLSPFEYRNLLSEVWDVYAELSDKGTKFFLKDNLWTPFFFEKGLFKPRKEKVVIGGCNCGVSNLTILPDGKVFFCRRFESPIGSLLTQGLEEIFLSDSACGYRDIHKLEGCKDCELLYYCRGCHSVSHGTYGSFFAKDPQCWFKS